jgi:integrase
MPVYKCKYSPKKTVWYYIFDKPGSTRDRRLQVKASGFATKREAEDAEARRRIEEQQKHQRTKDGSCIAAPLPRTLSMLLNEFLQQHAEKKLAPKTVERYREQAACLDPELLAMSLADITPLHLSREWSRLLVSGGRTRREKTPRPISAKTVRNIAGVVSSAFLRAIKWGLVTANPVSNSEPPVPRKHEGMALMPTEQILLIESATGIWCLPMFLEISAATGARRGEVLALRWSDVVGSDVLITRSLTQTKEVLTFKGTKTEKPRRINVPESVLISLAAHRKRQDEFRTQFGPDYRADLNLIFANPDGTLLRPDSVSASVSLLCRRLGLPKGASLHTLRHSHGSVLLADGVDLVTVSERLGHSSVRVTADIYSHALRGRDQDAARRWDAFMRRNGKLTDEREGRVN